MYANVVVDIESVGAPGPLSYEVPEAMRALIRVGSYVRVPLGTREALGYVIGLQPTAPTERTKPLGTLLHADPLFDPPLLNLAVWMSFRYHAPLAETLRCIVPDGIATRLRTLVSLRDLPDPEEAARSLEKRSLALASLMRALAGQASVDVRALRASWSGPDLSAALSRLRARGWLQEQHLLDTEPVRPRLVLAFQPAVPLETLAAEKVARERRARGQAQALELLLQAGGEPVQAVHAASQGVSAGVLRALVRAGLAREERVEVRRNPWHGGGRESRVPELTEGQRHAIGAIEETLSAGQHDTLLLHGVTASGKTEVYLHAIAHALELGRDAIVLLPEISLTAQVVEIFKSRFGDQVALLHSKLSSGERYDEWRRLRSGDARVAVGPRSALFAPCRRLGLIVMDEEHEPSYKQESSPRYHARRAALERARAADAALVLGSATPSVDSYYLAAAGEYRLVEMRERIAGRSLPTTKIADLRAGGREPASRIFSEELLDGIADRLRRGEQTILFLNRRGFASFILCRDCGYTARCPHCSVSLTLHAADHTLRCHHCNHHRLAPTLCPRCKGEKIRPFGLGTERVESEIRERFPEARPLRMDRDTTSGKDAHTRLYRAFRDGQADVLIGTQMVAKGLDFPGVTLVGVIAADMGLNIPDFRAAERTFQLLAQVAGRAGRGERPGEAIIQTFNPDHFAITAARDHDYASFYAQEIDFRRELGYPPFGGLVNLLSSDTDADSARDRAARAAGAIAAAVKREGQEVEILGPAPSPLARLKRRFRWHLVMRGPDDEVLQHTVRAGLETLPAADRDALAVDVDPMSMA